MFSHNQKPIECRKRSLNPKEFCYFYVIFSLFNANDACSRLIRIHAYTKIQLKNEAFEESCDKFIFYATGFTSPEVFR